MTSSIGFQLGIGSGLDIKSLVDGLSNAQRAPKQALLERREALNSVRISTLAEVSGAIDDFASALSSLISGGSLSAQPTVSEPGLVAAKALPGARLGGLASELEVLQLAKAQTLESTRLAARTDPIGQGTLTLTTAAGNLDIVIDASNDSLDGLAAAINAGNRGVTASIITDAGGARLVLKGATGAAAAYTLSVPDGTSTGLERFAFGPAATGGMTQAQAAQDAIVRVDGVEVSRTTNSFTDLIPGVQIDLKKAVPGTIVSLGSSRPKAEIEQGIGDFVSAFNQVMKLIRDATRPGIGADGGPLQGDVGVRTLQRQLGALAGQMLTVAGEGPHSLAEIGVRTNRDGTLALDKFRLQAALTSHPDAVEALFNPSQWSSSPAAIIKSAMGRVKPGVYQLTDLVPSAGGAAASGNVDGQPMTGVETSLVAPAGSAALGLIVSVEAAAANVTITVEAGLGGALKAIRDALRDRNGAFATANARLDVEKRELAEARTALQTRSEQYYNQLLKTFTAMERQVSASRATQSYLDQQIKMWTNDRG
jgi:flagellar hook-associated protein 2